MVVFEKATLQSISSEGFFLGNFFVSAYLSGLEMLWQIGLWYSTL